MSGTGPRARTGSERVVTVLVAAPGASGTLGGDPFGCSPRCAAGIGSYSPRATRRKSGDRAANWMCLALPPSVNPMR